MIMPQEGSPNWSWGKLGADIERNGFHRTVTLNGHIVCINSGYEIELAISSWLINPCPVS